MVALFTLQSASPQAKKKKNGREEFRCECGITARLKVEKKKRETDMEERKRVKRRLAGRQI